jgi:hypothetical protein
MTTDTAHDLASLRALVLAKATTDGGDGEFGALAVLLAYPKVAEQPMFARNLAEGVDFPAILAETEPWEWSEGEEFLITSAAALFNNRGREYDVDLSYLNYLPDDDLRVWQAMIQAYVAKGRLPEWVIEALRR